MRKLKLYIAMSLDAKIAKKDGDVNWLNEFPNPDNTDHGYSDFLEHIDTTLMGNTTYQQVLGFGIDFPYENMKNYVFTKNKALTCDANVTFISGEIIDFVKELKNQPGKDIWLIGGSQINTLLLNQHMIDELQVFVMPVVLGEGISLFNSFQNEIKLNFTSSKTYSTGAVRLIYNLV